MYLYLQCIIVEISFWLILRKNKNKTTLYAREPGKLHLFA